MHWETQKVIQSLQIHISHQILKCRDHLRVTLYLFDRVLGALRECAENVSKTIIHRQGKEEALSSHQKRFCSVVKVILGFSCAKFRTFGELGQFQKIRSQCSFLTFLTREALNLLGLVNYLDQVGHEILQNRYLKTNFENTEIRDFVSTF